MIFLKTYYSSSVDSDNMKIKKDDYCHNTTSNGSNDNVNDNDNGFYNNNGKNNKDDDNSNATSNYDNNSDNSDDDNCCVLTNTMFLYYKKCLTCPIILLVHFFCSFLHLSLMQLCCHCHKQGNQTAVAAAYYRKLISMVKMIPYISDYG